MTAVLRAPEASVPISEPTTYRPHLDGLRAIAVYLVVLFHAGVDRASGGFIGVDVFFVLSGYLVTQMLLRDLARPHGVRYGRFYARRARRLLPAVAAMLVITAVVYRAVAPPGSAASARPAFQASFLYVANWFFIHRSTGYFGAEVATNPVLHVWSLAVEEQFYLVWPLLLGGGFWLARRAQVLRPVAWIRIAVGVGAVASIGWALALQSSDPVRAYYGTGARAYQLLAGALLAMTPGAVRRIRRRVTSEVVPGIATMASGVALLVLATSLLTMGPISRGIWATVTTIAILALLDWRPAGAIHRFLSSGSMVYLGQISYGIYLWHWPVIVVADILIDPTPLSLTAITVLIATGLAAISFQLLEMPVRRSAHLDRRRFPVIAAGLTISLVGAVVVAPRVLADPMRAGGAETSSSARFTPVPADLDLARVARDGFGTPVNCRNRGLAACTIVRGRGPHVLLMGDSNATMLIAAFTSLARERNLTLSVSNANGCVWERGIDYLGRLAPDCDEVREDTYRRVIPGLRPDIIVLVNVEPPYRIAALDRFRKASFDSLRMLQKIGRTIILVKPIVTPPQNQPPLDCLAKATYLENCRFVADPNPGPTTLLYGQLAIGKPRVKVLDLDRLACPFLPICDPVIGGDVVHVDGEHLALRFSASLGRDLGNAFQSIGMLPQ